MKLVSILITICFTFSFADTKQKFPRSLKTDFDLDFLDIDTKGCDYSRKSLESLQLGEKFSKEKMSQLYSCYFFSRNLKRDKTFNCKVPSKKLIKHYKNKTGFSKVRGKYSAYGLKKVPYRYDLKESKGKTIVEVKIHFKNELKNKTKRKLFKSIYLRSLKLHLYDAAQIWNSGVPEGLKGMIDFRFKLAKKPSEAHYSVAVKEGYVRGPYYKQMSDDFLSRSKYLHKHVSVNYKSGPEYKIDMTRDYNRESFGPNGMNRGRQAKFFAHEIGHMLGLDDEYHGIHTLFYNPNKKDTTNRNERLSKCDESSIMCDAFVGEPMAHHYYSLLSRAACL